MFPFTVLFLLIPIKLVALFILTKGTASGELKPNRVSLFLWSLPALIGFLIAFFQGATYSAMPLLLAGIAPLFVLFISFISKHKSWPIRPIDYASALFSVLAIVLWLVVKDPLLATLFIIIADICAGIPTFIKTWVKPSTESAWIYVLAILGNCIGFATLRVWDFTTAGFSVYLIVFAVFMLFLTLHKKISKKLHIHL